MRYDKWQNSWSRTTAVRVSTPNQIHFLFWDFTTSFCNPLPLYPASTTQWCWKILFSADSAAHLRRFDCSLLCFGAESTEDTGGPEISLLDTVTKTQKTGENWNDTQIATIGGRSLPFLLWCCRWFICILLDSSSGCYPLSFCGLWWGSGSQSSAAREGNIIF